jgi:hypothetical protein
MFVFLGLCFFEKHARKTQLLCFLHNRLQKISPYNNLEEFVFFHLCFLNFQIIIVTFSIRFYFLSNFTSFFLILGYMKNG